MSYRDDLQAARMRKESLARELEDVEESLAARRALDEKAERLRREIAAAKEIIEQARTRISLPLLDRVAVTNPCPERWETMEGDDYVRFCRRCEKNVYDLSALGADQAEGLLRERGESMCITFYRRPDGTVLTQDCIGGTSRRARRRKGMAAAAVLAAGLGLAAAIPATEEHAEEHVEEHVEEHAEERVLGGFTGVLTPAEQVAQTRESTEALEVEQERLEKVRERLKKVRERRRAAQNRMKAASRQKERTRRSVVLRRDNIDSPLETAERKPTE